MITNTLMENSLTKIVAKESIHPNLTYKLTSNKP